MTSETTVEAQAEHDIDIHTTAGKLAELRKRNEETLHPVGEAAVDKVHAKGKLTARERIYALLDEGSFVELDALARHRSTKLGLAEKRPLGDSVVTGYGTIDGRDVCIFSQDVTVFGGSLGEVYGEKIVKVQELAIKTGRPLIGINDGAGARIQEGVVSLGLYSSIFRNNILASGVIPQISLIMGAAAGGPRLLAGTDRLRGDGRPDQPDVHHRSRRDQSRHRRRRDDGGARWRAHAHGQVRHRALRRLRRAGTAFDYVRDLLSYLPPNNFTDPPHYPVPVPQGAIEDNLTDEDLELDTLIPDSANQPYDMHEVITRILDDDEYLEVQSGYAQNIVIGFGRIEGRPVGIVANQPTQFAGCLDINGSEKAARFVRTCDCFNIPVVMLVDVPGFLPGTGQEYNGIIRRGAKLLYAYGEATVPKITVITRKAYGGAYCVMGSKDMGCDVNVAWPTAQIAVMGASGAVGFVYRQQLGEAAKNGEDVDALRLQLQQEYEDTLVNPYIAAERGYVDAVIPPSHTRGYIGTALRLLERKIAQVPPKKHGNIPL